MTREDAIKLLEPYIDNDCYTDKFRDACRMAIAAMQEVAALESHVKALEAELKGEKWRHSITKKELEDVNMRSVVRCKQCVQGEDASKEMYAALYRCRSSGILYEPDHYCSYGRVKMEVEENGRLH